jgi:hypothetical protein
MVDGSVFNILSLSKYNSSSATKSPNDSGSRSSVLLATPEDPPSRRRFRLWWLIVTSRKDTHDQKKSTSGKKRKGETNQILSSYLQSPERSSGNSRNWKLSNRSNYRVGIQQQQQSQKTTARSHGKLMQMMQEMRHSISEIIHQIFIRTSIRLCKFPIAGCNV